MSIHNSEPAAVMEKSLYEVAAKTSGSVHMLGIGGVGMAGLALLMKKRGWQVTGCDAYDGPLLAWLGKQGIAASVGHDPAHITSNLDVLVRSPAVQWHEPELQLALQGHIPVLDRGRLLPALLDRYRLAAISGTHGKTTTASMLAWMHQVASGSVSYCIGGVCPCLGAVAEVQSDGWMVVEADESDGTLQYYRPEVAVITSMDLDHVDYFTSAAVLTDVYRPFANAARRVVIPVADRQARELVKDHPSCETFGIHPSADWMAERVVENAGSSEFELREKGVARGRIHVGVPGSHNVANALAAVAAARYAGIEWNAIQEALKTFKLPRRRYETVAEGRGITVISDYAHHPAEIAALLQQARMKPSSRIVAVFQPHRYSRTKAFCREFIDVLEGLDCVTLAPVYSASESFVPGGASDDLMREAVARGHRHFHLATSVADAWTLLQSHWVSGDLVLIIGAGDVDIIGKWADQLLKHDEEET